ncbi:hypothetical protein G3M58_94490, partial [Streptomyces sp. SID7499]|nr:hypothetical protein [Streptomyces sp. SID7499]
GLAWAGRSVQAAASRALSGGDDAIAAYLKDGYLAPLKTDLRAEVFRVMESGGAGLRRRANTALDADTQEALENFLLDTRFDGQEEDEQVEVFKILGTASPQVKEYAERALQDGSAKAIQWFLNTGQHIARARDEEAATIDQLVSIVEREGKQARLKTDKAVAAAEQAKEAALKAKDAALT